MQCPFCGYADSKVTDSRTVDAAIRRRRECLRCAARFTTYERVQPAELVIVKKDGRREEFSREKLLSGIRKACEKRPLDGEAVARVVDEIEAALVRSGRSEVPSSAVGELVMESLRELDQIAYVRYASVYRQFTDIEALRDALDELQRGGARSRPPREQLPLIPPEPVEDQTAPRVIQLEPAARRRAGGARRRM